MSKRDSFQRDGYVAVPSFLSADEVGECLVEIDRYVVDVAPALAPDQVFYEDRGNPATLKQLQRMHDHDEWFREFFRSKPQQLAEELLGTNVVGKNIQFFNKPPGISQATPPHQDGFYFKLDPPEALTMWLALDDVDAENGCVRYVRASHLRGMREHRRTETLGFSQGMIDFGTADDLAAEEAMPASAGDLLAHHALTIHRADANSSTTRSRRALGLIFYSVDARVDVAAQEAYRRELVEQQIGRI